MIGPDSFYEYKGHTLYRSGFISDILKDPKVIFEFGSYDGGDGVRLKTSFPEARVISIEADLERYEVIKNMNENLEIGLEVLNCAVSDTDGEILFYPTIDPNEKETRTGGSGSTLKKTQLYKETYTHLTEIEPIKVQSKTLKTICEELGINEIDFLHMDVEGAEHRVIKGMGDLRPKYIFLEKHLGGEMYEEAYDWYEMRDDLKSLGYTLVAESPSDALFAK
jgi:FkbM family methyltransferase